MDKVNFDLVGNNQDLIRKISEAQAAFVSLGKTAEKVEKELSQMGPSAKKAFTGISDNMPVVINSLKEAREQFKGLNAAGQGSGPVWKQALSALGSWQTAVAAGITLLAIYGDKVVEWFQNLGKAPGYINKAKIEQDVLNESVQEYSGHLATAYSESGRQTTIISQLSTEWGKLGNDLSAKKKFIDGNKEAFGQLGVEINSVKDAENLLVKNTGNFIAAIKLRAKAMAGQSTLQSLYAEQQTLEEQVEMGKKVAEARVKVPTADDAKEARKRNIWSAASSATGGGNVSYTSVKQVTAGDIAQEKAQQMLAGVKQNEARLDAVEKQIGRRAQRMLKDNQEYNKLMDQAGLKTQKLAPINTNVKDKALKEKEQQAKLDELRDKLSQEERRRTQERENLNSQAEIDALDEGAEKKLKQLKLNQQKELQQLEREREDALNFKIRDAREIFNAEQEKKPIQKRDVFNPSTIQLSVSELKSYSEREASILERHKKELGAYNAAQKAAMDELLVLYGIYMEKRKAISDMGEAKKKGKKIEEQNVIDQQTQKQLNDLEIAMQKETNAFAKLFTDMKNRSINDIAGIIEWVQKALEFIKGGKWDKEQGIKLGISEETFNSLQNVPEKVENIKQALTNTLGDTEKLDSAFNKIGDGFEKFFSSDLDTKKLREGLVQIESGMNEVMAAGKLLSNSLSSIGNAFGNDALKGIAEGMNAAMDAVSATMSGAKAGAVFGPWGAAAGAAIGLATSLVSSIAKIHDAKNEKRIKVLQEQIETLNRSYSALGDQIEKAYSKDASDLIGQQNQLLEQQKELIDSQITEEQDKKNTDDTKIREYQNKIEDINKTIANNKEKALDAILGEDLKTAINNFAQAYADAWAKGDDKAKSSKDLVKNMIKSMVMEMLKADFTEPVEKIRKKLDEAVYGKEIRTLFGKKKRIGGDGKVDEAEQAAIEQMVKDMMNDLDKDYAWADRFMKDDEAEGGSTREASQKGIAQASQESVDKLDGVMTNIQGHTYSINDNVRAILETMKGTATPGIPGSEKATGFSNHTVSLADIDRNMSSMIGLGSTAVSHLSSIADNTARLMTIEQTMSFIKTGIDTMNTKGITIKR